MMPFWPDYRRRRHPRRRGSVLILALIILFALASLALTMNRTARVDAALAANNSTSLQVDSIVRGAEQYVVAIASDYRDSMADMTETDFSQVPVGDGYFWIVRPDYDDPALTKWGLMDETSKLNLNTANLDTLKMLPGMTEALAGAILDWRDEDDAETGSGGAETSAYQQSTDGYRAKNASFEAVEELGLIKGMTRELLYGQPAGSTVESEYYLTHGLSDFFTCYTTQPNTAADGTARLNLNGARDNAFDKITEILGAARSQEIRNTLGTVNVIDLFHFANQGGLSYTELQQVEDYLAATPGTQAASQALRGRININTAPRDVLLTLPIGESDVDALLARRQTAATEKPNSIAWVFDVLKEKSVGLGTLLVGQGRQFSADIVAVSKTGRTFKRVKIVVDTTQTPARIIYRRDITDQGNPLDASVMASLKAGGGGNAKANFGGAR